MPILMPARTPCAFFDYDNDGWMDIFILGGRTLEGTPPGSGNRLYHNNRDGTFTDVSEESGVAALQGSCCRSAVSIDVDEDGWPDIFVACDMTPSFLLMNYRDGTFRDEALLRGVTLSGEGQEMSGMGAGVGDYNLDSHTDIVKTHYYHQATGLHRNNGKNNFDDVTAEAGLQKETRFVCYGAGIVDLDNDGWPDILITSGALYPEAARASILFPLRTPRIVLRYGCKVQV